MKNYEIPFQSISALSDFSCPDGEIGHTSLVINDNASQPLPPPDIEFALVRTTLKGWHIHPDNYPSKTLSASEPSMEYWSLLGAQLLRQFTAEADQQGLFVAPFYVLAAWKSYQGEFLASSEPFLLIPNSDIPLVSTEGDINAAELELRIAAAVCSLYFRLKAPEYLRDWVGKIKSLQILVSSPLHIYNASKAFLPSRRVTTDNFCRSLDIASGEIADRRICTETLSLAWKGIREGSIPGLEINEFYPNESRQYFSVCEIPLSEVDLYDSWKQCAVSQTTGSSLLWQNGLQATVSSSSGKVQSPVLGQNLDIDVTTRPIKLSGAGDLKRISRVFLRGNYTPANLTVSVYASRDMMHWTCISRRKGGSVVALPSTPFRFYRVRIAGLLLIGQSLQGLVFS